MSVTASPSFQSPRYLSKAELATLLGISLRSVDRLRKKKLIPTVRLTGGLIKFDREDVLAAIEGCKE